MRRLSTLVMVAALAFGLSACGKHGAKNVYACPNKGPKVGFNAVKSGKLTVETSLPAAGWWTGSSRDTLTGGYEFELAKDLCAALGIGRVRIVDVPLSTLETGKSTDFDLALAHVTSTPDLAKNLDISTSYLTTAQGAQYVALLPKGSANTKLVNTAIAKLKSDGTLAALAKTAPAGATS
jgi:polar amino acid transport system substrate-binding protein